MSNTDRVLEALEVHGELDDDELSTRSGVTPRQQVNQLCRRLEAQGRITRVVGACGKLVNRLTEEGLHCARPARQPRKPEIPHLRNEPAPVLTPARTADLRRCLFILPCSARKATGGRADMTGVALHHVLSPSLRQRLLIARSGLAASSELDDDLFLPAYQRYAGRLYLAAASALEGAVRAGLHVLIISGGYGVVNAAEPIGCYNRVFSKTDWPDGILADAIADYARAHELRHARAFLASSTSYRKLLADVDWNAAGISDALLLVPTIAGGGSMVKAPRSLGEAFSACIGGYLTPAWRSSDSAPLTVLDLAG
jgi:hypothetical protein